MSVKLPEIVIPGRKAFQTAASEMYHDPRWCCGRPRLVVIASRRIHRQKVPGSSEMPSVKFELTAAYLVCKTKSIQEAACFTLEGDASIVTRPSSGILWFVLLGLEDGHPPRLPEVLPLWLFCGPCIYLFLLSHGQPLLQIFLNPKVWQSEPDMHICILRRFNTWAIPMFCCSCFSPNAVASKYLSEYRVVCYLWYPGVVNQAQRLIRIGHRSSCKVFRAIRLQSTRHSHSDQALPRILSSQNINCPHTDRYAA